MKNPLKILSILAAFGLLVANTSCTPTEAAIIGGVAGAAIGVALADDYYHEPCHGHRGYRPPHGYYYY